MRVASLPQLLPSFLLFLVEVHSQLTFPYVFFMEQILANHSYVDLSLVGDGNSVGCITDLSTCCFIETIHGDWYFPDGSRVLTGGGRIRQVYNPQSVDLINTNGATSPTGIYRCDIPTVAVHDDADSSVRDTVYVGLYLSNGGDVSIFGELTFDLDQLTITCISTGGPATTVTWTRDSTTVTQGTETVLNDPVTPLYIHTLSLTAVIDGVYTCTVSNNKPSSDSRSITLGETGPPTDVTAVQEGPTSILVSWSPSTGATGYRIDYDSSGGHSGSETVSSGSTNTHTLTGLTNGDTYTVSIAATSGSVTSATVTADMNVGLVPGQPVASLVSAAATTISISWSIPSGSVVDSYDVTWQRDTLVGCSDEDQATTTISGGSTGYVITGLEEDSSYIITLRAFNAAGSSEDTINAMTQEAVPSAPPSSVSVTGVTSTAITIQWGSVPCIHQNGDITGYSVRYAAGPVQIMSVFGMSLETTLPDLVSSTTYLVQVAAVNNVGTGEFSNTLSQMTLVAVPVLMVDSVTPTSISISWTSGGSEGVSYLVEWQRDTSEDQGTITITDGSTSYVISALEENSRYIIRVTASNAIGSEESDPVIGVTASQDSPVAVPVLMVDSVTPTSISISWTSGGSEGVSYLVEWQTDTSEDQGTITIADGSTSYVISGLKENSRYSIRVTASNAIGSEESDPVIGVTASQDINSGCPYGPDEVWGIIWPNTAVGTVNTQPCPGGVDTLGNATRVCYENGTWGDVNVLSCQSLAIVRVVEEARDRLPGADEVIEVVTPELLESVAVVSEQLAMATGSRLLPLDLEATNNVVAQILNVLESSVGMVDIRPREELVDVFNNILNESNQEGWTQLQTVGSGSQTLLQNAERYGTYLATTVNSTSEPLMLVRENIVVEAEVVDTTTSDVVFPAHPDQLGDFSVDLNEMAQITIPIDPLLGLSHETTTQQLSLVHMLFRNIEDFLPTNTAVLSNSRAESLVLSSQLVGPSEDKIPDDLFRDNPITLNFSFTANFEKSDLYIGVFWDFSDPVGTGGWSSEGTQLISNITRDNVSTVVFTSIHLTSFAVLVDVAGGHEEVSRKEKLSLAVVTYIGCIISTVCLSITVVFYLAMGKKLFSAVHYFVHLNLAISLLLGYVVFVFGIELGTSTRGGCGFVAALLQYLFLSAFCWMMCEGIMLYLLLTVVFSSLSKKWWLFMILGYCTPLLFVIIGLAARAEYYGVHGDDGELTFCWLSTEQGTIFAFVIPMIIIVLINTVFLVLALSALLRSNVKKYEAMGKKKSIKLAKTLLKSTAILLPLLGLTWLFGLLTLNSHTTVFAWLFTIFNSLQGTSIFFLNVMRSRTVWNKISPLLPCLKMKHKSMFYSGFEGHLRAILLQKPSLDSNEMSQPTGQTSLAANESQTETEARELESNSSSLAADEDDLGPLYSVAGGPKKHNGTRRNFLTESLLRGRSRDNTEPGKFTM